VPGVRARILIDGEASRTREGERECDEEQSKREFNAAVRRRIAVGYVHENRRREHDGSSQNRRRTHENAGDQERTAESLYYSDESHEKYGYGKPKVCEHHRETFDTGRLRTHLEQLTDACDEKRYPEREACEYRSPAC